MRTTVIAVASAALLLAPASAVATTDDESTSQSSDSALAAKKKKTNRLKVRFTGTPVASALPITVKGPRVKGKRYKVNVKKAKTLRKLPVGKYKVTSPGSGVTIKPATFRMKKKTQKSVMVTFPAKVVPPSPAASGITTTPSIHKVTITWNAAGPVTVRRTYGTTPAADPQAGTAVNTSGNSVTDLGLIPRTVYTYAFFSQDGSSTPASVTVSTLNRPIAAGSYHTCAIVDGGAKCWGENNQGQLGTGSYDPANTPQPVTGLPAGQRVVAIDGGYWHTCAALENGTVWCWGFNTDGQLGDGTLGGNRTVPAQVSGITDAVTVEALGSSSCALRSSGAVACWGDDQFGQLGNGPGGDSPTPSAVVDLADAVAIGGHGEHACALRATGQVVCWGNGEDGQNGDGTKQNRQVPTPVPGIDTATTVASDYYHNCSLQPGGLRCWGANWDGMIGDGTLVERLTPVAVSGLPQDLLTVGTGLQHTCVLDNGGGAYCWGNSKYGQLGIAGAGMPSRPAPSAAATGLSDAATIVAGYDHTCVATNAGAMKCWGGNTSGQLGLGNNNVSDVPVTVPGLTVNP